MNSTNYDVIIIGGGIMGSATAYNLAKANPGIKVIMLERDLSYEKASTPLSMVNARIQFSLKENVQISQYAFKVLENFEDEMEVNGNRPAIFYKREGNLFLYTEEAAPAARKAYEMQRELGCAIEWWTPDKILERFPIYTNLDGIVAGTYGPEDGHFDAYAVLMGYKAKSKSMGVDIEEEDVVEILTGKGAVQGVKTASGKTLHSSTVINCTGAWAKKILATAGIDLPVDPVRRQVFAVEPEYKVPYPLPLTILPSGFYFRTETGGLLLLGKSMPDDPVGFDFSWQQERFELLWEDLYNFAPVFESLKLVRGWAGLYAMSRLDENAIIGEWPLIKGLYLANGFSGHGLQQGPAVGRYLTELINKTPHVLDISIFKPERVLENKPIIGDWVV